MAGRESPGSGTGTSSTSVPETSLATNTRSPSGWTRTTIGWSPTSIVCTTAMDSRSTTETVLPPALLTTAWSPDAATTTEKGRGPSPSVIRSVTAKDAVLTKANSSDPPQATM